MYKHKYQKYKRKYLDLMRQARKNPEYNQQNNLIYSYRDMGRPFKLDPHYLGTNNKYRMLVSDIKFNDIDKSKIINDAKNVGAEKKILFIETIDDFDDFTDKYGIIEGTKLFIRWVDVANDFIGFGLSGETYNNLFKKRYKKALFEQEIYPSWWEREFDNEDNNLVQFIE